MKGVLKKPVAVLALLLMTSTAAFAAGNLVVYSPNSDGEVQGILYYFGDKYNIKISLQSMGTGECLSKLNAEKANPPADVMFMAMFGGNVPAPVRPSGLAVHLLPQEVQNVGKVAHPVAAWVAGILGLGIPRPDGAGHDLVGGVPGAAADLVAALVSEHYGGEIRDLETFVGASSLARISLTVRAGTPLAQNRDGLPPDRQDHPAAGPARP